MLDKYLVYMAWELVEGFPNSRSPFSYTNIRKMHHTTMFFIERYIFYRLQFCELSQCEMQL